MPTPRRDLAPEPWQPSYPTQAVGDNALYNPSTPSADDTPPVGKQYEPAPPTSHLVGWKVLTDGFSRKFLAESLGFAHGTCLLEVAFRAKGKQPQTQYYYGFATPEQAEKWGDLLRSAAHPGEHIPDIQSACVGYRRRK